MGIIRTPFISGTILNNPLAIGDTTLSSNGLGGLAAIAAPDIAKIILDPAGSAGNPEVVYVTAHSAAATTATIARAKESSTARAHAVGIPWVHGPTVDNDYGAAIPEILDAKYPTPIDVINVVPAANDAFFAPIVPLTANCTSTTINVTIVTQAGNIDVGIYEWDGSTMTRIVSSGSVACPAAGNASINITDTTLYRGTRYYFALAVSSAAMSFKATGAALYNYNAIGYHEASSFPLPATVATLTSYGYIPFISSNVSGGL